MIDAQEIVAESASLIGELTEKLAAVQDQLTASEKRAADLTQELEAAKAQAKQASLIFSPDPDDLDNSFQHLVRAGMLDSSEKSAVAQRTVFTKSAFHLFSHIASSLPDPIMKAAGSPTERKPILGRGNSKALRPCY